MAVYIPNELRQQVIERAHGLCEYCLIHQDDTPFSHHIDHVIALKHEGKTELMNLALSCLTTFDSLTQELTLLFNPRTQQWGEHFVLRGVYIVGIKRPLVVPRFVYCK